MYLIDEQTVMVVREALQAAIDRVDERCGETGCMCDMRGSPCSQYWSDALHELDSNLRVAEEG